MGPSILFRFDVLAQLANIPAQITLYELLRPPIREALREATTNYEVFLAQIPAMLEEKDDEHFSSGLQTFPTHHILFRGYANQEKA